MSKYLLSFIFCAFFISNLIGQQVDLEKVVSLNYKNVRLEDALKDISTEYQVNFSYSKHYVPIDQRINIQVSQIALAQALDKLFEPTEIVYANIGDQIVLKKGKRPDGFNSEEEIFSPQFGSISNPARAIDQMNTTEPVFTASNRPYEGIETIPVLTKYNLDFQKVSSGKEPSDIDVDKYYVLAPEPEPLTNLSDAKAQVSIVPLMGTNMENSKAKTNNFSLNVLGGENGGVDGVEIGGLFNKVEKDVKGVQIAGLFNSVGGDVGPSVLIDGKKKKTFGVQVAGLVNKADNVHAVQIGGLWNANSGNFKGVQLGGLFNRNGGDTEGLQIGGLSNINGGNGGVQIAGIMNVSKDIEGIQISGIFNKAKNVQGSQIALINVADSISGASIGFLNFVKNGYNQIELGASETMYAQFAVRFGSRRFYNIFELGTNFQSDNVYTIGYGIGITQQYKSSHRWQWNTELMASHISENKQWFGDLNLLVSFRLTAEYKVSNRMSAYFGPSVNVLIAKIKDPETLEFHPYDSTIPPYTLFDNKNDLLNPTDVKAWIGIRAGIRFGKN